jgi:hypothetical protein
LTLANTSTGTILGTVNVNTGGTTVTFTNNGDLTIGSAGLISSTGGSGNSAFTLNSGATLRIGSTNGITTSGTSSGNIQVDGTRTIMPEQTMFTTMLRCSRYRTGYPNNLTGSLTIDNPNGVTITANNRTISTGTLNLIQGTFATNNGGNRLSLGSTATLNRSGGSLTGTLQGGVHTT